MNRQRFILHLALLLLLVVSGGSMAGTTGKIIGIVTDAGGGVPLPGANIRLLNTTLGASTDTNGEFVILNIPPGRYDVEISMLGYQTVIRRQVAVSTDLTTRLKPKLKEAPLEGEEVVVEAQRPLILRDATSKLAVVGGSEIITMPVADFNEVVASQAGITTDANGELHLRGGRTNELAFFIDGQPVENPLDNSFSGLIDNYAIRELQVLSGTFNAEYGAAMSGVINIVTNEGENRFRSKVEYTSGRLNASPYRKANALVTDANPFYDKPGQLRLAYRDVDGLDVYEPALPAEGTLTGYLAGPILRHRAYFFFSGEYKNQNDWLPFGYNFSRSGFGKITVPLGTDKFTITGQFSRQERQPYSHRYKYLPQNYGHWEIDSRRFGLRYNHVFSQRSFFILNASLLRQQSLFRVDDLYYSDYIFPELDEVQEFIIAGNSQNYTDIRSKTLNLKGDWLGQVGLNHEVKSGFELNFYDLKVFDYTNEGNNADEFFLNRFNKKPITASLYLQDKVEFESVVINAGLRGDYVDVKSEGYRDIENPLLGLADTKSEFKLSPRLGLAYPVRENTVLHFSYGHFFQFPNFQEIYRNLQFLNVDELARARLALIANPRVRSQKTIAYEFGVSQKLSEHYALNLTAYSRDITDLLGTIYVETLYRYAIFTNNDFARIQGVDISLEKRMSRLWSAKLDYTFSVARGSEATPTEEAYNIFEGRERSVKEFYLDFDRTHDIAFTFNLQTPESYGPSLLGMKPLSRFNFSVLAQFSSGLPYTPISDDRTKLFEKNSARMPWTNTVDIRLEKFFPLGGFTFSAFMEVTNLFDRLNPLVVQPRTGKLWDDGKSKLFGSGQDFMHNPAHVGPPREIHIGLSMAM